jgi:hypothetical protein
MLLATVSAVPADIVAYRVDPVKTEWSASTGRGTAIWQSVTCNFDTLVSVDLFAGGRRPTGARYHVVLYDGKTELTSADGVLRRHDSWVRFEKWSAAAALIRGKLYELKFTRNGSEGLDYYYEAGNPYRWGSMRAGGTPDTGKDLAMRVYGRMRPVSDVWRAVVNHGNDPPGNSADTALARAERIGVKWIRDDFGQMWQWEDDTQPGIGIYRLYENRFNTIGILGGGSDDSTRSSRGTKPGDTLWRATYPPRNLYEDVNCDTNWWARYCEGIMGRMPDVKYWEVLPEANPLWFFRCPDKAYYLGSSGQSNDSIDTNRERCSLYVRMCYLAKQVVKHGQKIIGGGVWRLTDVPDYGRPDSGASGVDWLKDMFYFADNTYGSTESCFDIVSVHPYMDYPDTRLFSFIDDVFDTSLDTAHSEIREAGHPGMELWATEYGWPRYGQDKPDSLLTDTLIQAENVCRFYTSSIARQADPRGGYGRAFHYELTGFHHQGGDNQGFGLLEADSTQDRLPLSWAFEQLDVLTGRRCDGRVMSGETAVDNNTRMFEFEDPATLRRTWVCWPNGDMKQSSRVKLPVRTDELAGESLAYSGTTPAFTPRVADDGWLTLNLNQRPIFIHEAAPPQRPDMAVDSVRYDGSSRSVRAWVTNHGSAPTPVRSGRRAYPTWAVLKADGDSVTQAVWTKSIGINQGAEFGFELGRTELPDTVLLSVTVNPNQTFVELETDDNTGYTLKVGR